MYQNPVNDFYLRNAQSAMQMYQPVFPPISQQPQIKTYFVTGIEEARAAMIDPLATNIFLDTSSGKIYMKNLGNDGKPQFISYTIEEKSVPKDPIEQINSRLTNIENYLGGIKNEKSISSNAGVQQSFSFPQSTASGTYESDDETEPSGLSENAGNDLWQNRG